MYLPKEILELVTFMLLGCSYVARAAPRIDSQALDPRALEVRNDGPPPLPAPKDDDLPQGDGKDLLPWSDDDIALAKSKRFLDYNEYQDQASIKKKRIVESVSEGDLPHPKRNIPNHTQNGTELRMNVGIDYLAFAFGNMFRDSTSHKFVGLTGVYGRDKQLGIEGTRTQFRIPDPLPSSWRPWQADYIVGSGFFFAIAKQSMPEGMIKEDWSKITDAIVGKRDDRKPSQDTANIAKQLNSMSNLRGITLPIWRCKNSIMSFAHSAQATKDSYKIWNRSSVWAVYRYMRASRAQFVEVTDKTCAEIAFLIKDEKSGTKIANHYRDEINRIYQKAIKELERILATPQAPNDHASVFKAEDCKNDVHSANQPSADGGNIAATAPFPDGKKPITQSGPMCNRNVTYSLADTQSIYEQLKAVPVKPGADAHKNCWTDPSGGCNLLQASGGAQLLMCGPTGHVQQFASCADLALALNTLNIDCQKDYQVGGRVGIPYLEGVTLELHAP